jgi:hypothetical protein
LVLDTQVVKNKARLQLQPREDIKVKDQEGSGKGTALCSRILSKCDLGICALLSFLFPSVVLKFL